MTHELSCEKSISQEERERLFSSSAIEMTCSSSISSYLVAAWPGPGVDVAGDHEYYTFRSVQLDPFELSQCALASRPFSHSGTFGFLCTLEMGNALGDWRDVWMQDSRETFSQLEYYAARPNGDS